MTLLAALSFVQAFCIVGQTYGLTWGLVEVWKLHALHTLGMPILVFLACYTLRQLCDVAKQRIAARQGDEVVCELRPRIQSKVFRLGPSALAARGTGSTVTMLIDGLDEVKSYVQIVLPKMLDMMLVPLVVLVFVWLQNGVSGLILLLMFPLLIFFMVILGLAARDRSNKQYAQFKILNSKFVDSILGLPTLKMLGMSEGYEDEIYSTSEQFRKRTISVIAVAMTSTFALDFFATLGIAIMAVFLGIGLINGTIVLFPALFALILAPEYFMPIRAFGENYHATLNGKNALGDVMHFLGLAQNEADEALKWDGWTSESTLDIRGLDFAYDGVAPAAENSAAAQVAGHSVAMQAVEQQRDTGDSARRKRRTSARRARDRKDGGGTDGGADGGVGTDGGVEAAKSGDVEAAKCNDADSIPDALHDISFRLHGYEKVAVVGRSGAGKSTLVNLLAGFNVPDSGEITLDGMELRHFNALAWQRHISYIPQTPYIFSGTIADNIRFYVPDADDGAVAAAASQAGLDGWLDELPERLQTAIGEGNRGISGGQAQRIALARVLLDSSREILIFDEPTAHLDIETEYELKKTLLPIMDRHLVIFATHRLHWLADVDQVVVLDQGHVVEQGRPDELIGTGGALDALIDEMGGNQIDGYRK